MQQWQLVIADPESPAHCRHVQQVEHVRHGDARLRQAQQLLHCSQQGIVVTLALVGDRERDMPCVALIQQSEDSLDVRRIDRDVGHHHDDVAWPQTGVRRKRSEQLVVQHLHLALRPVRHMKTDRPIGPHIHRRPARPCFRKRAQVADVILDLLEQRGLPVRLEAVDALADGRKALRVAFALVVDVEQPDKVATLLAPGRQQGLGVQVQGLVGDGALPARAAQLAHSLGA